MSKLKQEIKTELGDKPYQRDQLNNLAYLNYCVKEALRLDTPTSFSPYKVKHNFTLKGKTNTYHIPKGVIFSANPYVSHFVGEVWHKAEQFIPERWDPEHEYFKLPSNPSEKRHPNMF